ncbi:MAG TPA: MarR family winged helix-turn-helix transcriptional regulator [Gemmatimonadaceae bacterium]|nr:MarR family winged helix-turn-helix transcriptional regulator [Gemmatimonadaceae bacterium]
MVSRIQAELKQNKPFRSLKDEAAVALLRTAAVLDHALNDALSAHDLTVAQYNALRILRGAGSTGLCGREVGERMIAPVPDVTRMLDRLEAAGLIRRERDTEDRRHVTVRITAAGLRCVEDVTPTLTALERRFMGNLDNDQLTALLSALDAIRSG